MRERRVFMLLGIVLAVFALGLAYAAVTTGLEITGNVTGTFDSNNFQVKFSHVTEVTGTNGVNVSGSTAKISSDPTIGTFSFTGFTTRGQTQSATWTISNANEAGLYALIEISTATEVNSENFKATIDLADDVIAPNETTTVTVTVECIKTPEGDVSSGEMTFGITAITSHTGTKELITFTIEGTEYQAEEGMTWGEWVESSYNTAGYSTTASYVTTGDTEYWVCEDFDGWTKISPDDAIISDSLYWLSEYGGGGWA